ncbi:MAG: RdgB/HAM1 family non-canonical purine NTP pyrophosphatase [Acidobacteria bacterium]|nr:RdgB/HAM1 family non-canonical purine NTP pyrophosphatase [Acidobacteriota bacterium]
MMKIVLATTNKGKISEVTKMLRGLPFEIMSLSDFDTTEVIETGKSFRENSELKASSYAAQTKHWTIADDSGLEVYALDNAPGIFSARFAGESASDQENTRKLLEALSGIDDDNRSARFVCSISIANNFGEIQYSATGICSGLIAKNARGLNGFGYDPVFIPEGFEKTFGELDHSVKQEISHRSKALKQIITFLSKFPSS